MNSRDSLDCQVCESCELVEDPTADAEVIVNDRTSPAMGIRILARIAAVLGKRSDEDGLRDCDARSLLLAALERIGLEDASELPPAGQAGSWHMH